MATAANASSGHRKRLKQRFLRASLEGFHDYEVLELLLTFVIPRRDVKPVAKELIKRFKGLKGVFEASPEELSTVSGVGETSAHFLSLLKEIASAYVNEPAVSPGQIKSPSDAADFVALRYKGDAQERFIALYLNSKNELLGAEELCEGGLSDISISARAVIRKAFDHNARSIIFVHTLPGAPPAPSGDERRLSGELERAAASIDIIVHDHIIMGNGSHISGRELGWLKGS